MVSSFRRDSLSLNLLTSTLCFIGLKDERLRELYGWDVTGLTGRPQLPSGPSRERNWTTNLRYPRSWSTNHFHNAWDRFALRFNVKPCRADGD
jgi:hypothetical protein